MPGVTIDNLLINDYIWLIYMKGIAKIALGTGIEFLSGVTMAQPEIATPPDNPGIQVCRKLVASGVGIVLENGYSSRDGKSVVRLVVKTEKPVSFTTKGIAHSVDVTCEVSRDVDSEKDAPRQAFAKAAEAGKPLHVQSLMLEDTHSSNCDFGVFIRKIEGVITMTDRGADGVLDEVNGTPPGWNTSVDEIGHYAEYLADVFNSELSEVLGTMKGDDTPVQPQPVKKR